MLNFEEVPIFDNLHGFVKITSIEKEIINSLYFQRLRDIKQLSLAYYVFPGAVHTRFSHSIGVLATTQKILERLEATGAEIEPNDFRILRMAALLHDIGHYPLSHLIEQSYKSLQKKFITDLSNDDEEGGTNDIFLKYQKKFPSFIEQAKIHNGHHEKFGAYIIENTKNQGGVTYILKSNGFTDDEIKNIALIIEGKSLTTWYNQIMHSELDVDRLDYLMRDSQATGVHYGNFDFDYLVNNCRLISDGKKKILAVKSSAAFTVEHFLLARYFWYAQIIHERTISIFDHLGNELYQWLITNEYVHSYIELLELVNHPKEFIKFNDNYFWHKIYSSIDDDKLKNKSNSEFYREVANCIVHRKPLKRLDLNGNFEKILNYKNFGCANFEKCENKSQCLKSIGCPKFENEINLEQNFIHLCNSLKKYLEEKSLDSKWVIGLYKKSSISNISSIRDPEEKDRDYIRISVNGNLKSIDELKHSAVKMINEYELIQPRIYVKEEYASCLNSYLQRTTENS